MTTTVTPIAAVLRAAAPVKKPRPIINWSYSALNTFENCPRKFWATKVAKVVSDLNQANVDGDNDHKALQYHMSKGMALPPALTALAPLCSKLKSAPGEKYIEYSMCLKQDFTPTPWNNWDEAWVRGAGDVIIVNGDKAQYFDWKRGKFSANDDQIELTSLLIFAHFPAVQQVAGGLVFYNQGKVHPHMVHRGDASRLWNGYLSRVRDLEQSKTEDSWPATPNPLCGWCPYKACPHNTQDERLAKVAK